MADGNNQLIKYTTEIPIFDTQELHDPLLYDCNYYQSITAPKPGLS